MLKVIAFDVFGTVFDLKAARREEVQAYGLHISQPEYSPLELPKSWEYLPAHSDSAKGIARLRNKFLVVTCSNGPLGLLIRMAKNAGIVWDGFIPMELNRVFKPRLEAYQAIRDVLDVEYSEVMMVTANEKFGDLEAAQQLGMRPQLIRNDTGLLITDLAARLGC